MRFKSILIIFLIFVNSAKGAKILSVFGYPRTSQYIFVSPLLKALAERGHEITSITMFPQAEPLKNFRDISIVKNAQPFECFPDETPNGRKTPFDICEISKHSARLEATMVSNVLDNPQVKTLMMTETFDLIILRIVSAESLLGLGEHFKAPVIAISTRSTIESIDYLVGNTSPSSYVANSQLAFGNRMSLQQRIINVLTNAATSLCHTYFVLAAQEKLYKKYFPSATRTFDEARKKVSLVLLNDHYCLSFPRPYVPNMVEVGGMHIQQQPDPLSTELQQFLDESTEGVIYFSLGTNVKSSHLTNERLQIFLQTFRELHVKVLWKFENDTLPQKPDNLYIQPWFPQSAILAHANVKLFITHGGKLSMAETIFHGKPILGLPAGLDQPANVENAVRAGYAIAVPLRIVTKESLKLAIGELLANPGYSVVAQRLSECLRDQPMSPLQTAIYWVEYVLRHKGAGHLRNAGQDLTYWQYHNIDVYAILLVFAVTLVMSIVGIAWLIGKFVCGIKRNIADKLKVM